MQFQAIAPTFEVELTHHYVGKIGENHWAAVCAHRGDNVRIISVRRARKQEIDHYESK